MMEWIVLLFLEFFTMYPKVYILDVCNNYETNVGMNCTVKFVEI